MSRRRTNRALLIERLTTSYVARENPKIERARDGSPKYETSHFQSMAHCFGEELIALSEGAAECREHPGRVEGHCPPCRGLWVEGRDDPEEEADDAE